MEMGGDDTEFMMDSAEDINSSITKHSVGLRRPLGDLKQEDPSLM